MYKTITMQLAEKINQDLFRHLGDVGKETIDHEERVAEMVIRLNQTLEYKFSEEDAYCGAILHDIGKSKLPKELLIQKENLSEEERKHLEKHPELGLEIYLRLVQEKKIFKNKNIEYSIHYHQERLDGKGYPEGLSYGQIPLIAMLVCVVDSYDAMTTRVINGSKRILTKEEALDKIREERRTHFEPEISKKFIEMEENGLIIVRSNKN